jgi:Uma2 family endonuclease
MATAAIQAGMRLTLEELHALPDDGKRYELIDGVLFVTPSPEYAHQDFSRRLFVLLYPYARDAGLDAFYAPADVTFGPATCVQPDLFVIPRRTDGTMAHRFEDVGRLLLAVEAISPSSSRTDRREKRDLYMREGVPVYWIVDGERETVEVWRPRHDGPELERERLELHLPGAAAPLVIDLPELFRG